jgi:hypothetical protein
MTEPIPVEDGAHPGRHLRQCHIFGKADCHVMTVVPFYFNHRFHFFVLLFRRF